MQATDEERVALALDILAGNGNTLSEVVPEFGWWEREGVIVVCARRPEAVQALRDWLDAQAAISEGKVS